MPRYEFKCEEHGLFEVLSTKCVSMESAECPVCHVRSERDWLSTGQPPPPFHAYWTEALKGDPKYIKDKDHEAHCLGDEYVRIR